MKSKNASQNSVTLITESLPQSELKPGFDPFTLPFPKNALTKKRQAISAAGREMFDIFTRTGTRLLDHEIKVEYNLAKRMDAFSMLITDRDFDVHQTAPQSIATAKIISAIALQAEKHRIQLKLKVRTQASFEKVLAAMDKVARAIGPLADYRVFDIDVETATAGIYECMKNSSDLFDKHGKCNKQALQSQVEKMSVVCGEGPVKTTQFITRGKAIEISRAVKSAGIFDFSVGSVPVENTQFMEKLALHLEKQRLMRAKLH